MRLSPRCHCGRLAPGLQIYLDEEHPYARADAVIANDGMGNIGT
jgi:hypothetical protein